MKAIKLHWALALLLCFPSLLPAALTKDAGIQPIEVTADKLRADSGTGQVTFEGGVVAKQGDVTMFADILHAEYSRNTNMIERVDAEGNVRFLQEDKQVTSDKASLFNLEQRAVFSGRAILQQGGNTVHGETITVYMDENRAEVKGSEEGGRVKAVLIPQNIREATKP